MLLAVSSAQSPVLDFVDGFVVGIEKNANSPDECASDTHTLISAAQQVVSDVQQAIAGNSGIFTQLLQDAVALSNDFDTFNGACDFTELIKDLTALTTSTGVVDLVWRFVDNEKSVMSDVDTLKTCNTDYTTCGEAAGHLFSTLVGYQI